MFNRVPQFLHALDTFALIKVVRIQARSGRERRGSRSGRVRAGMFIRLGCCVGGLGFRVVAAFLYGTIRQRAKVPLAEVISGGNFGNSPIFLKIPIFCIRAPGNSP